MTLPGEVLDWTAESPESGSEIKTEALVRLLSALEPGLSPGHTTTASEFFTLPFLAHAFVYVRESIRPGDVEQLRGETEHFARSLFGPVVTVFARLKFDASEGRRVVRLDVRVHEPNDQLFYQRRETFFQRANNEIPLSQSLDHVFRVTRG